MIKICKFFQRLKLNKINTLRYRDFYIFFTVKILFDSKLKLFICKGFDLFSTKLKNEMKKNRGLKTERRAGQQPASDFSSRTVPFDKNPLVDGVSALRLIRRLSRPDRDNLFEFLLLSK